MRRLLHDPGPVLDELRASYGPVCALGWGAMRTVIVGDPASIADLHAAAVSSFQWNHKFNVLGFVVGQGSMIVSDGDDHRHRRAAVTSGFARPGPVPD